jgi:hypothetical protein
MKTYKINNVEISEEQIKEIIKDNPELLNEKKGGRYFFPKEGKKYWRVRTDGSVIYESWDGNYDRDIIPQGVYRTEEEVQLASAKQKAIVACWKWAQENAPFEPYWGDDTQTKFNVNFDHSRKTFFANYCHFFQVQFTLPYFKSKKDCESFIEANKEHLELLFTK